MNSFNKFLKRGNILEGGLNIKLLDRIKEIIFDWILDLRRVFVLPRKAWEEEFLMLISMDDIKCSSEERTTISSLL